MKTFEAEKTVFSMENDWPGVLVIQVQKKSRAVSRRVKDQAETLEEVDPV